MHRHLEPATAGSIPAPPITFSKRNGMIGNKAIKVAYERGYRMDSSGGVSSSMGRTLKLQKDKSSYRYFSVKLEGKSINVLVHRFQAYSKFRDQVFFKGIEVRHLDGIPENNSWGNIALGYRMDNVRDAMRHGTHAKTLGSRRFTVEEIVEIRNYRSSGKSYAWLCDKFNTSKSTLSFLFNKAAY